MSQQETARLLGDERMQAIVDRYVPVWQNGDADALAAMLADDAVLAMPPHPVWFGGRDAIRTFVAREPMAPGLHLEPTRANGQLAFECSVRGPSDDRHRFHALHLLTLRGDGRIREITDFLEPLARRREAD